MKSSYMKNKKTTKWIIGTVAACILIFLGVQNIDVVANAVSWCVELIMPLLLGFAFALILNVPMRFFEAHLWNNTKKVILIKLRRPLSFIISLVLIIGILTGVVWLVIPELVSAVKVIIQGVMDSVNMLTAMNESEIAEIPFAELLLDIDWQNIIDNMQDWLKNHSGNIMNTAFGTISSVVGGIFDFFMALIFSIYILFNKEKLKSQVRRLIRVWLPRRFGEWLLHASRVASGNFRSFVAGQSLEAAILGILCMLGMLILRIPYAPMVGALVGVTALIPVVGAFIGAIVGAFMILTVDPIKAIIFVVFLIILQQLEGNIIYPKVMGNQVNLPAMWILAAVTIGGGIAGPVGMLLSVPIASTVYILVREATEEREKRLLTKSPTDR
ncbi:MAG: AI-2E family transporter [Clostridia bacterium]|nr:AI-2E family transporter [Clostridia bacterium]MBQ9993590.1 AI-2E family transporter [Clostridia bacterium]